MWNALNHRFSVADSSRPANTTFAATAAFKLFYLLTPSYKLQKWRWALRLHAYRLERIRATPMKALSMQFHARSGTLHRRVAQKVGGLMSLKESMRRILQSLLLVASFAAHSGMQEAFTAYDGQAGKRGGPVPAWGDVLQRARRCWEYARGHSLDSQSRGARQC